MRNLALAIALAACGGGSSRPTASPEPAPSTPSDRDTPAPVTRTCDDAVAHLATLPPEPGIDSARVAEGSRDNCVAEAWSAETIACVTAASTWTDAAGCFAPPPDPICEPLRSIIKAGTDGLFESLREGDAPYIGVWGSTAELSGKSCTIHGGDPVNALPAVVWCEMDEGPLAQIEASFQQIGNAIIGCLPDWTPKNTKQGATLTSADGRTLFLWLEKDAHEPDTIRFTVKIVAANPWM